MIVVRVVVVSAISQHPSTVWLSRIKKGRGEDIEKVRDMGMGMATATVVGEKRRWWATAQQQSE